MSFEYDVIIYKQEIASIIFQPPLYPLYKWENADLTCFVTSLYSATPVTFDFWAPAFSSLFPLVHVAVVP